MQQRELNSFHVLHCWWKCSAEFWRKTLKAFKIGCDLFPSDCQDTSSGDIYWIWGANLDREREEGLNIQTNENFGRLYVDFQNIHYLQLPLKLISIDIQILIFISELHDHCNI